MQVNALSTVAKPLQQEQGAAVNGLVNTLADVYSAKVAGKTYTSSVEKSGSDYVANVPNLVGVKVSGFSLKDVEESLGSKIDFFA